MRSFCFVVAAVSAVCSGWALVPVPAAGASCIGPMIEVSVTGPGGGEAVGRGETLDVRGSGFGTDCYDTGPPPEGEGVLGRPGTGIEVVFTQAGTEVVVAEGRASPDYSFDVTVVVPAGLAPGEAVVSARYGAGLQTHDNPIVRVSDAVPVARAGAEMATFGPAGGDPADGGPAGGGHADGGPAGDGHADRGGSGVPAWAVVVLVLAGLSVVGAAVTVRRRTAAAR